MRTPYARSVRFFAVRHSPTGEERFPLPMAATFGEAVTAAGRLLAGYGPREASVEVFKQADPRIPAARVWRRSS